MSSDRALGAMDLHAHSEMSDGDLPIDQVAEVAAARGVTIGIADHVSGRNPRRFISDPERLRAYLDALERAPVLRSAELCWCDEFSASLGPEVLDRLDYVIGSNHGFALPDGTMASPWWSSLPEPWAERPQELMEIMVHNLCDLVRTMPIDIVAHSTLTPPALYAIDPATESWWTEEREDRYVDALLEGGVVLEISNRYRLPHDRLLRKAREAGVRFSLGSDGHHEHQIARLEWAAETARRVGITDAEMFVPQR